MPRTGSRSKKNWLENKFVARQTELQKTEHRLIQKETFLDHRVEQVEQKDKDLDTAQEKLRSKTEILEGQRVAAETELQRIAQLNPEEARAIVLDRAERDTRSRVARMGA